MLISLAYENKFTIVIVLIELLGILVYMRMLKLIILHGRALFIELV